MRPPCVSWLVQFSFALIDLGGRDMRRQQIALSAPHRDQSDDWRILKRPATLPSSWMHASILTFRAGAGVVGNQRSPHTFTFQSFARQGCAPRTLAALTAGSLNAGGSGVRQAFERSSSDADAPSAPASIHRVMRHSRLKDQLHPNLAMPLSIFRQSAYAGRVLGSSHSPIASSFMTPANPMKRRPTWI
jgi:hypothetical protein